jgi:hypothetical protein
VSTASVSSFLNAGTQAGGQRKAKVLEEQRIVVPLLEGVRTVREALGLDETVMIGGIECRALLPVQGHWPTFLAGPPAASGDDEQDHGWPLRSTDWGENSSNSVIIRAVGIIPAGTRIPAGDEHIDFDRAAAQWRQLLRDWLAVAAEGPTDSAEDYYGATIWGSSEYDDEEVPYQPHQRGHRYPTQRLSAWAWTHALGHASAGDQPPLARALMTTAARAAVAANWRVAIIDAATAAEVALTAGLAALSATLQSHKDKERIASTRMLGPLLGLARDLGMSLPPKIDEDLKDVRNAVVHRGADMTSAQAKAAITAAWAVVHQYDPLPACCHEPGSPQGA